MTTLQATLFVEDVEAYKNMLDTWLGGSVWRDNISEETGFRSVFYRFERALLNFTQAKNETNTALQANGGAAVQRLIVESRDRVDALLKKAIDTGLSQIGEIVNFEYDNSNTYMAAIEDKEKQYWHIAHFEMKH